MNLSEFDYLEGEAPLNLLDMKDTYEQDLEHFSPTLGSEAGPDYAGPNWHSMIDRSCDLDAASSRAGATWPSMGQFQPVHAQMQAPDQGGISTRPPGQDFLFSNDMENPWSIDVPGTMGSQYWPDFRRRRMDPGSENVLTDPLLMNIGGARWHQAAPGRLASHFRAYDTNWLDPALAVPHSASAYMRRSPASMLGQTNISSYPQRNNDEVSTLFITGFPDDITEREFNNMFLFARGFEAATLKYPVSRSEAEKGQAEGSGNKIRQTIGFAKFVTRDEAMVAREVLNGFRIAPERGCILKSEMANKNLHVKHGSQLTVKPPVPPAATSLVHRGGLATNSTMNAGPYDPMLAAAIERKQALLHQMYHVRTRENAMMVPPSDVFLHQDVQGMKRPENDDLIARDPSAMMKQLSLNANYAMTGSSDTLSVNLLTDTPVASLPKSASPAANTQVFNTGAGLQQLSEAKAKPSPVGSPAAVTQQGAAPSVPTEGKTRDSQ